jgi:integrase/recombinase XerD
VTPLAPLITDFLRVRLPVERGASRHTCDAYAYAFKLLFEFTRAHLGVAPSALTLEQIDAPLVLKFLEHLQTQRRCSANTRNARLAAIKSFMRFVEHRVPSALAQLQRVLAIPTQKTDSPLVRHLTTEECQAILDVPDPESSLGVRDRAMLHLTLSSGVRVSELVALRLDDVEFHDGYLDMRVRGKGRKERCLRLWKSVARSVRAWMALRPRAPASELFLNSRSAPMTRSGFEHVLARCVQAARRACPTLRHKRVSPHVLRHTCALVILQATGDIRKVALWLGHESTQTTEVYLRLDPQQRLDALGGTPPSLRPGTFSPPDRLIQFLNRHRDYAEREERSNPEKPALQTPNSA